ncbi:MAG TPA: thiamine biosynthesis protein ApbE [Runella sp.]|nr:thiamine biosynthesis protein ApbE [Runella sp.]HAO48171.1 thiamine biosynthesis protein ApbE [Runella sp.]
MGNRFEISAVSEDETWAQARIDEAIAEIQRIEALFTTFNDNSQTNRINANAGISPVKVDREVFELVRRSLRISEVTQGAFDITYGSIDKSLWNFDTQMTALPDPKTARQMVRLINYRNVILDEAEGSVFLKEKGMRIGFGGIGKGYAAEMAKRLMIQRGVENGIVNASGDLTTWGTQPNGEPWTIGIAHPDAKEQPFSYFNISNISVATSGNYEKYVMIGGKKYSHTIDPKTGLPVAGIKSVTIICPNAEIADAMATPVTVMGVRVGLDLINQMQGMACVIIDDTNRVFTSKNIKIS